jgi:hypothetical protein
MPTAGATLFPIFKALGVPLVRQQPTHNMTLSYGAIPTPGTWHPRFQNKLPNVGLLDL